MRRLIGTACAVMVASGTAGATAHQARAATTLCVGSESGCYSRLEAAIDAARDGDTIRIERGTFQGGVTVDVSIRIIGAGAGATIIRGGNSVLTIGRYNATTEPAVSIAGLTITGGAARSNPASIPLFGVAGVWALGGGIEIPASKNFGIGATVTIVDSRITDNRAAPTHTVPLGPPCPGNVKCPFAVAAEGGIDNWGTLTLLDSTVSDNFVGSASGLSALASDAVGGGIFSHHSSGALVLNDSVISDNHVSATAPNGRSADSGGVLVEGPTLAMTNAIVTNNTAELSAAMPTGAGPLAIAGGVHLSGSTSGTIRDTTISDNADSARNTLGVAIAFSGGLHADGPLVLSDDAIINNTVSATTPHGSSGSAFADSGAGEVNGPSRIRHTRFAGNSVQVSSPSGTASAAGGAFVSAGNPQTTVRDSVIRDNRLSATTTSGSAIVQGAGIQNIGQLTLRDTVVADNTGTAYGSAGIAQGGGVWNSPVPNGPPSVQLTLVDSAVTGNKLTASPGITVQGGGLYTTLPLTLIDSTTARNVPDQCFGC